MSSWHQVLLRSHCTINLDPAVETHFKPQTIGASVLPPIGLITNEVTTPIVGNTAVPSVHNLKRISTAGSRLKGLGYNCSPFTME